jgi:transposase
MSNEILIPPIPDWVEPEESEDFLRCVQYVVLRELGQQMELKDIADRFGVSRQSLYNWITRWRATGLIAKVRQKYFLPGYVEEIQVAYNKVLSEWPQVMKRQLNIAIHSKSDQFSTQAAAWLMEQVVKPATEAVEDIGREEMEYVELLKERVIQLNPLSIAEPHESA